MELNTNGVVQCCIIYSVDKQALKNPLISRFLPVLF